jgi:hypothetical protein
MRLATLIVLLVVLVMLYILGHHEWHHGIVMVMNDITSFFTGSP